MCEYFFVLCPPPTPHKFFNGLSLNDCTSGVIFLAYMAAICREGREEINAWESPLGVGQMRDRNCLQ